MAPVVAALRAAEGMQPVVINAGQHRETLRLLTDIAAYDKMAHVRNPYGDGHAAARIVERLRQHFAVATH